MTTRAAIAMARFALTSAMVAVLMVSSSASAAPAPAPSAGYGFGDGAQLLWLSPGDINRELDAVALTGASWLRVLVPWSRIETAEGVFDWDHLDTVVDAAGARNLKVLGVIAYSPEWTRQPGTSDTSPPDDSADYARFAATLAQRYASRVSNWQLWNEPNLPMFFGGSVANATRYTELVKAAYPAIKEVQPSSTVVLAGLSRLPGDESPPAFLAQMYAAGAAGSFDAVAAHPYVFPTGLAANPENGWSDVAAMRGVMMRNGDVGKKIWMTELGAPTCDCPDGVSQWEQAKQITDVLSASAATGYSGPAMIYSIRDIDSSDRGQRESNFGALLTSDWQPKLSAAALAR